MMFLALNNSYKIVACFNVNTSSHRQPIDFIVIGGFELGNAYVM